jgi:hypothetical protein
MASGRMILFLVFLFKVPAQAPEFLFISFCDHGPTADMLECIWEEPGKDPGMKKRWMRHQIRYSFVSVKCLFNPH